MIKKEETILLLVLILYFIHKKSPIKVQNKMYICIYAILCILLTLPYIAEITHENFYEGQFGATYLTKNIISLLEAALMKLRTVSLAFSYVFVECSLR